MGVTSLFVPDPKTCDPLDLLRRPEGYQVMGLKAGGEGVMVVGNGIGYEDTMPTGITEEVGTQ